MKNTQKTRAKSKQNSKNCSRNLQVDRKRKIEKQKTERTNRI